MNEQPTNKDLMEFMAGMKEDLTVVKDDVVEVKGRLGAVEDQVARVELKVDRALFHEIARLEKKINEN